MKKKQKSIDELLEETIQKQLSLLQEKLNKANDMKSLAALKVQIVKFKAEIEALKPSASEKKKKAEQLDFVEELTKPDFKKLKIGENRK